MTTGLQTLIWTLGKRAHDVHSIIHLAGTWKPCMCVGFCRMDVQLEYKYIIINQDGRVNHWKPGANCKLDVHATNGTRVLVTDSWDDHGPRQVQVDAQCPEVHHAPHAPPHTQPQSQEACPQGASSAQHAPQPQATHTSQQTESPTPPTPTSPSPKPMPGLHHEAQLAMGELQEALERQHKTLQCVSDPTSMEVILGDRLLAAANNKAVAMNRALKAVEALPVLPAPSGSKA